MMPVKLIVAKQMAAALVSCIMLSGWVPLQENNLKMAEWLIGTWEHKTPKRSTYETWSKLNDTAFAGRSYMLKAADTVLLESIHLVQEHNALAYIPTVLEQNKGLPVKFVAKKVSDNQLVFENASHDFPQIISYTKISTDSLVAEVSGIWNGQERKQSFAMKRVE